MDFDAKAISAAALAAALVLGTAGCRLEDDTDESGKAPPAAEAADTATPRSGAGRQVSTPITGWRDVDPQRLERERYDPSWRAAAQREYEARRRARAEAPTGAAGGPGMPGVETETAAADVPVHALRSAAVAAPSDGGEAGAAGEAAAEGAPAAAESWEDIAPDAFAGEAVLPLAAEAAGPTVLRLQWMLDRAHFSPGVIDGRWGKNTEKAVYWLQEELGWEPTGEADRRLFDLLSRQVGSESPVRQYTVTAEDVAGPFVTIPEEPEDQAELDCLCYESAEELLAERFHVTPELLAQLNPGVDLAAVRAGQSLWVPNVVVVEEDPGAPDHVARIVVSKSGFYVHGLDDSGAILYHFPSTLGSEYDPSPSGGYSVAAHAYDPNFHYQPELFSEVPDEEADLMLPPGPNSPVGLVWLDLSKPNFGIHGTSEPSTIGYATSHGCIRLTNWDAVFLANHVAEGTPVEFRE